MIPHKLQSGGEETWDEDDDDDVQTPPLKEAGSPRVNLRRFAQNGACAPAEDCGLLAGHRRVARRSQLTSNLRDGGAAAGRIPASRKPSSHAASRGRKPRVLLRGLLAVPWRSMVSRSHLRGGGTVQRRCCSVDELLTGHGFGRSESLRSCSAADSQSWLRIHMRAPPGSTRPLARPAGPTPPRLGQEVRTGARMKPNICRRLINRDKKDSDPRKFRRRTGILGVGGCNRNKMKC